MQTENIKASLQNHSDWLPPTLALTHYRPPDINRDIAMPTVPEDVVIGFHIGSLGFLLAAGSFCEVLGSLPVDPLPNVQPWFSGLLNLRGNLAPVFDLRALLNDDAGGHEVKRYLLAVGRGDKTVVLWIDGLPAMLNSLPPPLQALPTLTPVLQRYVSGGHLHAGQLWFNVHLDELFKALGSRHTTGEKAL